MSIWKETKNEKYQVISADDFLADPSIPDGIKASYQEYIQKTNVLKLDRNEKGYYKFEWLEDNPNTGKRYQPTYNDRFGWGVMRGPIPAQQKKQDTAQQKLETEQKPTFASTSPKSEASLARIADAIEIIAKVMAEKNIETADKMLAKHELEAQEASE